MNVNIDYIGKNGTQGELAALLHQQNRLDIGRARPWVGNDGRSYITTYNGGDPKDAKAYSTSPINSNATLRRDEWKQLDDAVVRISESRLGGVQDLVSNNLTYNLGNAMGTTVLEWHDMSDAMEAQLTMDAVTRGQNDRPKYESNYLPIPIVSADYEINARELAASRSLGNPLSTTIAERATRKVNEMIENMLFTDTDYKFGGGTIYSYLNHPDRNQVTLSQNWDASGKTGAEIVQDLLDMKQASINAYHLGPWMVYVPTAYETVLDEDYYTSGPTQSVSQTIRERLLKISGIKGIKVVDTLPANNVLMVQMTSDVVQLVRGMPIQNMQWETEGGMLNKFKVLTIQVPWIRSDQEGHSGLMHLS